MFEDLLVYLYICCLGFGKRSVFLSWYLKNESLSLLLKTRTTGFDLFVSFSSVHLIFEDEVVNVSDKMLSFFRWEGLFCLIGFENLFELLDVDSHLFRNMLYLFLVIFSTLLINLIESRSVKLIEYILLELDWLFHMLNNFLLIICSDETTHRIFHVLHFRKSAVHWWD